MRIAITGGSGRIGRAVITLARSQGHNVVSIDRAPPVQGVVQPGLTHIQAEITDYSTFAEALRGCDALVHLAAIPSPLRHPDYLVHNNNVVTSYNALSAAAQLGIERVCQASSINATGAAFSRWPRYDYLPLDEQHPTHNEDPYSLSKWICEQQADSFARRYEDMAITSLRFHGIVPNRAAAVRPDNEFRELVVKHLWGYICITAAARACLLSLTASFTGHEVLYIVAPDTVTERPSLELKAEFFPDVPVTGDLSSNRGFFNTAKAERLLGWKHNE